MKRTALNIIIPWVKYDNNKDNSHKGASEDQESNDHPSINLWYSNLAILISKPYIVKGKFTILNIIVTQDS